ncbi:DNA-binding domain-containing protein [Caulobacter sp. UNC279MFTsu5.1]|uniref:HvfC/BufC N-terminal domain-containing protein n=1 Tax=Caulobacter sp. UNC279MFTsu5.1 TaxID=1502775 RepID=UPI0008EE6331|nr:DNA-binding domain-containing protein [Caulobacter sp. UNC279MFTsu5.1]SFI59167.1 Putative DNA-binding domain-containing protein [Caulobacter sp. UNC279MFTsu5.1]
MSLLSIQRGLRDHILANKADRPEAVAANGEAGLAVYRHAYRAQLVACLRDTFEQTWSWLGDDGFDAAAISHIAAHPPRGWTLDAYGEDFPQTLAGLYPDDPEVAELAWLDWSLRRAFDGPDADPITPEALAQVDWESAVLTLSPTLTIGAVATNSAAIWGALTEGQTPPAVERLPAPAAIRVWRQGLSPRYRTIDAFERLALLRVLDGCAFAQLCEQLGDPDDTERTVERVGGLLGAWLQDGLVLSARS